ncbi:MAG: hypothetical protein WCJ25_03685 [Candidatus Moraniibacteriota bacterium]
MANAMYIQDQDDESLEATAPPSRVPSRRKASLASAVKPGAGRMSLTTMLLGVMVGLIEWFLSFAFGWIPGVSWLLSFVFTFIQTMIVYFDPSTQHLSFQDRAKLFLMREGVLVAAGALSGIPILGEIIPFEAIAMFLLRLMKVPTKATGVAK